MSNFRNRSGKFQQTLVNSCSRKKNRTIAKLAKPLVAIVPLQHASLPRLPLSMHWIEMFSLFKQSLTFIQSFVFYLSNIILNLFIEVGQAQGKIPRGFVRVLEYPLLLSSSIVPISIKLAGYLSYLLIIDFTLNFLTILSYFKVGVISRNYIQRQVLQ